MAHDRQLIDRILDDAKQCVAEEITSLVARNRETGYGPLYDLVADYPFREGKGLRPAILLAAARSAGGYTDQARTSAAALELYHNAFLVHDDVEDASDYRRGRVTMLREHGAAVAVNVGDATNVLAMQLLLENMHRIGVHKSLLVLEEIERMARESVEGQAIELDWIANHRFDLDDADYVRMAHKKTCWYTVIAPLRIGVICGHPPGVGFPRSSELQPLVEVGHLAGIAFQVCDDLLNLESEQEVYGKEIAGDLWEGKRTVMLLHHLRTAGPRDRARSIELLSTARDHKHAEDVAWLLDTMRAGGSIDYGRAFAHDYATRAAAVDDQLGDLLDDGPDRRFLREMLWYVVERAK